jgi:nicotinate-nucleotide pyrophosphorylase (carboxylating)
VTNGAASGFPSDAWLDRLVAQALAEDGAANDVTSRVAVDSTLQARGRAVVREDGVVAGLPLLQRIYARLDPGVAVALQAADGAAVSAGTEIAWLAGPAAALLAGERTALNFVQHLSGIATLTARYVEALRGTRCRVLDTRKTLPGFRRLAKYAVRAGGGTNHRFGLHDRFLFKDNHWSAARGEIERLVHEARRTAPDLAIEVEVDTLEQLKRVLPLGVAWILLDNFDPTDVERAVELRRSLDAEATRLEVSGGINLATVRAYAEAGADAVSIGRLTHSAPALDVALEIEPAPPGDSQRGGTG